MLYSKTYSPSKYHESFPYFCFEEYSYPIIIVVVQLFYYPYLNILFLYSSFFLSPLSLHSNIKLLPQVIIHYRFPYKTIIHIFMIFPFCLYISYPMHFIFSMHYSKTYYVSSKCYVFFHNSMGNIVNP